MTRLWLLRLRNKCEVKYDIVRAMVVRASTAREARVLASLVAEDEGAEVWTNRDRSLCIQLQPEGAAGVILRDSSGG